MLAFSRRYRILVSLLLGVLLLDVGLLGALNACASSPPIEANADGTDHATLHHSPGTSQHTPDTEQSSREEPAHCPMPASCALVGVVTALVVSIDHAVPSVTVANRDDALPASLAFAPEPPPPRV